MAQLRSYNGYVAAKSAAGIPGGLTTIKPKGAPDTTFRVRAGDVATVLQYVIDQYQARVEDIDLYTKGSGDDWGYTFRMTRGSSSRLSCHSSATAIDINSTRHPLGTDPHKNFSDKQLQAMRNIIKELRGVVQCGAFYSGRKDGMHWEIDASPAALAKVARDIKSGVIHGPDAAKPKPDITEVSVWQVNHPGDGSSKHVYWVQKWLNAAGADPKLKTDGYWGPATGTALYRFRRDVLVWSDEKSKGEIGIFALTTLRDLAKSKMKVREGQ